MPTGSRIVLRVAAEADIPTPDTDQIAFFADSDDGDAPAWKDDAGVVTPLQGTTGATGPGYGGTSTTSLAIGTGSKAFTTQAGLAYVAGSRVRAASDADPDADWMEGVCTAYSGTTLTVLMDLTSGAGTHTDWNLSVGGEPGATGPGVADFHGVRVYRDSQQAISSSTATAISFSDLDADYADEGYWDIGDPTKLIIPVGLAGPYLIFGAVEIEAGGGQRLVYALLNGTDIMVPVESSDTNGTPHVVISSVRYLAEGDELQLVVYQDSGTSKNVEIGSEPGTYVPSFGIVMQGGAEGPEGPAGSGTVDLTGDSGSAAGKTDITFVGADVTDDGGVAATVTIAGGSGPRIVRGKIQGSDASILQGTGFSCVRNGTGDYTITITSAFSAAPIVVGTVNTTSSSRWFTCDTVTTTSIHVYTSSNSALADLDFYFIAMDA